MVYTYKTAGVCSRTIDIELDETGEIRDVIFNGGCNGNGKGVRALVIGRKASEVAGLLKGVRCENKSTSCPDQLSKALEQVLDRAETTDN